MSKIEKNDKRHRMTPHYHGRSDIKRWLCSMFSKSKVQGLRRAAHLAQLRHPEEHLKLMTNLRLIKSGKK